MDGPRSMPNDGRQIEYYIYIPMYHIINSIVMKHPENTNLRKGKLHASCAGVDGGRKMTTNRTKNFWGWWIHSKTGFWWCLYNLTNSIKITNCLWYINYAFLGLLKTQAGIQSQQLKPWAAVECWICAFLTVGWKRWHQSMSIRRTQKSVLQFPPG